MRAEFAVAEPILLAYERGFTPQQNWEMLRTFLAEFDAMGLKLPEDAFLPWKGDPRFPLL